VNSDSQFKSVISTETEFTRYGNTYNLIMKIKRGCINYQLKAAYIIITNVLGTPARMCSINFEREVEWRLQLQDKDAYM